VVTTATTEEDTTTKTTSKTASNSLTENIFDYLPYVLIGGSVVLLISIIGIILSSRKKGEKNNTVETPVTPETPVNTPMPEVTSNVPSSDIFNSTSVAAPAVETSAPAVQDKDLQDLLSKELVMEDAPTSMPAAPVTEDTNSLETAPVMDNQAAEVKPSITDSLSTDSTQPVIPDMTNKLDTPLDQAPQSFDMSSFTQNTNTQEPAITEAPVMQDTMPVSEPPLATPSYQTPEAIEVNPLMTPSTDDVPAPMNETPVQEVTPTNVPAFETPMSTPIMDEAPMPQESTPTTTPVPLPEDIASLAGTPQQMTETPALVPTEPAPEVNIPSAPIPDLQALINEQVAQVASAPQDTNAPVNPTDTSNSANTQEDLPPVPPMM
jgi:hypothetical protein